jgi:pimeloyl-ACP methyl ester carboxylesterase
VAEDHGARLISFDRPGYGRSSPAPFSLSTVSNDVAAIADELGIETFAVFGQSAGSAYAMAVAALHPERVLRVGLASVGGPFDPGWRVELDVDDQAVLALIDDPEAAAELAATFFEAPVELAAHAADDELVAAFEPMLSAADCALLQDPTIRA